MTANFFAFDNFDQKTKNKNGMNQTNFLNYF